MRRFWIDIRKEANGVKIEVGKGVEVTGFMKRSFDSIGNKSWPPTHVAFAAWDSKVEYKVCLNQSGKMLWQGRIPFIFTFQCPVPLAGLTITEIVTSLSVKRCLFRRPRVTAILTGWDFCMTKHLFLNLSILVTGCTPGFYSQCGGEPIHLWFLWRSGGRGHLDRREKAGRFLRLAWWNSLGLSELVSEQSESPTWGVRRNFCPELLSQQLERWLLLK